MKQIRRAERSTQSRKNEEGKKEAHNKRRKQW